ncbi:MAG: restriction endonuclease subunit S [Bacteroidales bacterium]|nr:restriction endonuclease subunit S [Bacteroidales bacterium]
MGKQNKIPQLRFPEFKNDWDSKELSEIATKIGDGIHGTPKYDEEGEYFFINGNNLIDGNIVINETTKRVDANEFRQHGRDISDRTILLSINGTIGNLATYKGEAVVLGKSAAYINIDDAYHLHFAYYSLLTNRIQSFFNAELTGSTIKNLSLKTIRATKIFFSSFPEQQKIASFFIAIDQKISQLKKKKDLLEQYKKGVMQKIFSQKLRFRDENGKEFPKWEKKKLGEVSERNQNKNRTNTETKVLTNSAISGIVLQSDYFDKDIANQNNLLNYFIVEVDDFVYNPRISVHAPVGPIKRNHIGIGVMSPLYSVFRITEGVLDFFELYFSTTHWHEYMKGIANYGARSDRMNITTKDLYDMPIPFPALSEQTKIANFLSAIDDKITHTHKQIEKAEVWKKGLMQQMFV